MSVRIEIPMEVIESAIPIKKEWIVSNPDGSPRTIPAKRGIATPATATIAPAFPDFANVLMFN